MSEGALVEHWDRIYRQQGPSEVSWYQHEPQVSLALLDGLGVTPDDPVVDVGGGASTLAACLLDRGFRDVTVIDLSDVALAEARDAIGERAGAVHWLQQDVLTWRPERRYRVWHDRAVFHFLVDEERRRTYLATVRASLANGGVVVMGAFAADGPEQCSGLPVRRYDPHDLAEAFGPDFCVLDVRREEHHTPGGGLQPFTWVAMRYDRRP